MRVRSDLRLFSLLALMMLIAPSLARAQDFLWAKRWHAKINRLAVDRSHNIYSVGELREIMGTVDFDPGPGTFFLTASGGTDVYVSKLDREGRFLWAKQLGGTSHTFPLGAALDDNGNVYIVGYFGGTTDFDPGPGTFEMTYMDTTPAYVCKLDSSGNFVWAIAFETSDGEGASAISVTVDGDQVYTVGFFLGTVDFDPGQGTFELTSDEGHGFVSKLDSSGNFVWAKNFGDGCHGVALDSNDNVYTTGWFYGTDDFDPGPGAFLLTSFGEYDGVVSKLDSAGNFVWAVQLGGALDDAPTGMALDSNDNVYTAGWFYGTADFDPGTGTFSLTSFGGPDAFVSKLDSAGNFVWAGQLGGALDDGPAGVALDSNDNVYTAGWFYGTADFDPGPGTFDLTSFGGPDAFVSKLDSAGNFVWARQLGGAGEDRGRTLALDSSNNVYAGGDFSDTADFDPGPGTFLLTAIDEWDDFVWKFGYVDIQLENQDPTLIHFSPDSPPVSFDVVTGLMSDLLAEGDFAQATCLGTFAGNPATDASTPPLGDGYYYLARGLSCCTTQGYGDSTLIPDPRDDLNAVSPCP